jgi:hypothetical protein
LPKVSQQRRALPGVFAGVPGRQPRAVAIAKKEVTRDSEGKARSQVVDESASPLR